MKKKILYETLSSDQNKFCCFSRGQNSLLSMTGVHVKHENDIFHMLIFKMLTFHNVLPMKLFVDFIEAISTFHA